MILTLYVQVGEGEEKCIEVREGDKAPGLALRFCGEYGIGPERRPELERKFQSEIDRVRIADSRSRRQNMQQKREVSDLEPDTRPGVQETVVTEHGKYFDDAGETRPQLFAEIEHTLKEILKRESKNNRPQAIKASSTAAVASKGKRNFGRNCGGSTLYTRWLRSKESMDRYREESQRERERKELEGVTFHPRINSRSKSIVMQREHPSSHKERLVRYAECVRQRADVRKSMSIVEEMKKCTFKPEICKSKASPRRPSPAPDRNQTFTSGKENCSRSRTRSQSSSTGQFSAACTAAAYRNYVRDKSPHQAKQKSKPPAYNRNRTVCAQSTETSEDATRKANRKDSSMTQVSEASNRIAQQRRREIFRRFFGAIVREADGRVGFDSIEFDRLPMRAVELFAPLFKELEEMKTTLDADEFVDAAENLYNAMCFADRSELLSAADIRRPAPTTVPPSFKVSSPTCGNIIANNKRQITLSCREGQPAQRRFRGQVSESADATAGGD